MKSLLALTALMSLAACASDYTCEEWCEDLAQCSDASAAQCAQDCDEVAALNDDAGCDNYFDLMMSCVADEEDVCAESSACTEEAGAWLGCVLGYCQTHTSDERCAGLAG